MCRSMSFVPLGPAMAQSLRRDIKIRDADVQSPIRGCTAFLIMMPIGHAVSPSLPPSRKENVTRARVSRSMYPSPGQIPD
jgi:hypothetical protein